MKIQLSWSSIFNGENIFPCHWIKGHQTPWFSSHFIQEIILWSLECVTEIQPVWSNVVINKHSNVYWKAGHSPVHLRLLLAECLIETKVMILLVSLLLLGSPPHESLAASVQPVNGKTGKGTGQKSSYWVSGWSWDQHWTLWACSVSNIHALSYGILCEPLWGPLVGLSDHRPLDTSWVSSPTGHFPHISSQVWRLLILRHPRQSSGARCLPFWPAIDSTVVPSTV